MKHPEREEWVPLLFGEATGPERKRLNQHLHECPECAREFAGWRRSLRRLDRWPLPRVEPSSAGFFSPTFKWALAALVVFGLGFFLGKWNGPSEVQLAKLRTQMEASLHSSLMAQIHDAMDNYQTETANAVRAAETRLTSRAAADSERLFRNLVDVLNTARAEDSRVFLARLQEVQERSDSQFVDVRKDLETLASTADEEIRNAKLKLIQLASSATPLDPLNN
ncbi:MAG: hypothetical protein U1G07_23015 [Verrucomicrobiota bacterium]